MTQRHAVTMLLLHPNGPRDREAREELGAALPGAEVSKPDEQGVFEIVLDAESWEDALARVWEALASSGTEDHITILEHPDADDSPS
jgi:hypothetical protein